ncbi:MAG: FG-GAP-like repeat-containing protein [Desulfuromonadales bacterium]
MNHFGTALLSTVMLLFFTLPASAEQFACTALSDSSTAAIGINAVHAGCNTASGPSISPPPPTPSIIWRHQGDGKVYGMTTDGSGITGGNQFWQETNPAWSIVGQGDFDGDGIRDLVWWNSSTGQVYIMLMSSPTAVKSAAIAYTEPNTSWRIVAAGDINGDARSDLIWWNSSTGQVYAMLMNGTSTTGGAIIYTEPNTAWKIVSAADFDANGSVELLWWNSSTGQTALGRTNGTSASSAGIIWTEPNTNWRIAGAGDLDGDGKADIIWHNRSTGQVYGMQTNGSSVTNGAMMYTEANTNWQIVSVGNYNGDNKADLLWWNQQTGQLYVMPMNGLSVAPGGSLLWTEPDTTWHIQGETEWRDNLYGKGVTTTTAASVQIGAGTGATIKPLLGENAGPLAASSSVSGDFTARYKEIGVRSVRTHDFLIYPSSVPSANPTLYPGPLDMSTMYFDRTKSPTSSGSYNFTLSDQHFAAVVNGGFEPFFRLGDSAGLTKPPLPTERSNWERAAVEILKHYTQGQWSGFNATINEVEIWNEPDSTGFWNRSQSEFMSLYVETAAALRAAFPTLRIGGPGFTQGAVTAPASTGWLLTFLDQVKTANAPLDFISFHIYSNDANEPSSLATSLRSTLDGRGFTSTKIYITEWNTYANAVANLTQAQAYRSGALGASTLTAGWIRMQDAPVDRLFHYRGSDPNANTPEDYGLYTGAGSAKRTALAFRMWSTLAGTPERLATTVTGNSSLLALAGNDANGTPVILVVNTANAASSWTPVNTGNQALSGTWKLQTISDNSTNTVTTTPVFPISIPAYGVQLLSAN